ncbi:MAG: nucleotidyltransferase family protein, partial [Kangiellaceae bacterium]|nr:nucleotidyltransferase family protein [Kangiellaceae bacterium]
MEKFRDLLSSELRLIALLSPPQINSIQVSEAQSLLEKKIDHSLFRALLEQHRVWPCVYLNINSFFSQYFPKETLAYLKEKYQQNVSWRMHQFRIESKLLAAFKEAQIPLSSFKGNLLAKKLYGDIAKRHSHDIDLVTKPEYLSQANEILNQQGFRCDAYDEFSQEQLSLYFSSQKDLSYINDNGFLIELHIRLTDRPSLLSEEFINQLLSSEPTAKNYSDYEFVYLCWHSAQNLHFRLKWLLDIALYIQRNTNKDREFHNRIWTLARKMKAERHVAISWILSDSLYSLNISKSLPEFFLTDKTTIQLVEKSILTMENDEKGKSLQYWIFWRMREFAFYPGITNKLSILVHMLF